jgi:mono/diheme cytochrome c family protein
MRNDRKRMMFDAVVWTVGLLFAFTLMIHEALAKHRAVTVTSPTYKGECGSCHVPYPPALLPEGAWREVLSSLDMHFGTDASVDAASLAELRMFLYAGAERDRRTGTGTPAVRITETDWFRREHREVPAATWKGAAVRSPANCAACHSGAENGDYSERGIRVPK